MAPCPRLARYVECYWFSENDGPVRNHQVLPDGCVDILFSSLNEEPIQLLLVGLMTARRTFDWPSAQRFFGVRFRPGMATAFIREAAELTDKVEPLNSIIGRAGRLLFDQLAEAAALEKMIPVVEAALRPLEPPNVAQKVLEQLGTDELSVDRLASRTGISMRQLRRLFAGRAGVSPKYLMRILRFRNATHQLGKLAKRPAQVNWAQLAVACGYFDQAHFIREFQEFTACTPGRYLQSLTNGDS